jgi:predicted nucleic acid-binding protein
MRDDPQVKVRVAAHTDPIATSVVVLGEIRYGLDRLPAGKKRADLEARAKAVISAIRVEPVSEVIGQAYGVLKIKPFPISQG